MPNIPTYNAPFPSINISDRAEEAYRTQAREVGALGREGLHALETGAGQLESGFNAMAGKLLQNQKYQDRINGVRTLADMKLQNQQELQDIISKTSPDQLPQALATHQQQFGDRLDAWSAQFAGSDKETQLWATEQASTYKLEQAKRMATDNAVNAGNKAVFDIGHTANSIAGSLSTNPTTLEIDSALHTWDQATQAVLLNPAINTPEMRAKIQKDLEGQRGQFVETGIYKMLDTSPDPTTLAPQLNTKYGQYLSPQQQRAILDHSQQQSRQQFWQNRASDEDQRRIEKQAASRALTDLTTSTFAVGQDGKPTGERYVPPNYFSKAVEIANMPGADHAMVKAAIDDAQQILNRQKNGVIATTDPTTYQALFGKAYNGLTDQDIFTAHAAGKLSDHDSTMFHQAVADAAKNPQMADAKRQFDFFVNNYAKPFIVKSDMMQPDPIEFQRLQQFTNDKWLQYQQGIAKGVSAHDLLDQRSPNFIGTDVTRYQLTPEQKTQGLTKRATTGQQPIPPVQNAAPARLPGESAADYLKRTGPGGQ